MTLTIALIILLFTMYALCWRQWCTTDRQIETEKRLAVSEYKLALLKQLEDINAAMYKFESDLVFLVQMSNDDARINWYNDVLSNRYIRLVEKILTIDERIEQNAPDGKAKDRPGQEQKSCRTSTNDCTIPKRNVNSTEDNGEHKEASQGRRHPA